MFYFTLLRTWLLLASSGLFLLFTAASCSKKDDAPTPTTGTIEGTVSPAGALTTVTATDGGGLTFVATPNATTGAFSLASLKPGTYQLSFTPAATFAAPAVRSITVAAGQAASAGTVLVSPTPPTTGTLTGTISPAGAVTLVSLTHGGTGAVVTVVPNATTGAFSVPNLPPGTYTLNFTPASGYDAPNSSSLTVTAGQTTAVGTIMVSSDGSIRSGSMTWSVNGVTYSAPNVMGGAPTTGRGGPVARLRGQRDHWQRYGPTIGGTGQFWRV